MFGWFKNWKRPLIWAGSAIILGFLLVWLSRYWSGFAQWHAAKIFPVFPNTIGRILSPIPFSVYEWVLYLLIVGALVFLTALVILILLKRRNLFKKLGSTGLRILLWAAPAVFLMLTLTCSINYGRIPFGEAAGYEIRNSSVQELEALCRELAGEAADAAEQIRLDGDGCMTLEEVALHQTAKEAMGRLGEEYPSLRGYYPNPKPVTFSRGMSHLRLTGMYSPFTIEANYNRDIPHYEIPYTICHELAHLKGYIREDEAGFVAYLACRGSSEAAFRYSGALNALSYAMNALYGAGARESYAEIYASLPEAAKADYQASRQYWKQFETKVAEVSTNINDGYLKANAQSDGVRSYGRMVDLLLAERRSR